MIYQILILKILKGLFIEVADNSPNDQYRYYVTIYTGSRPNAGTTAAISMRLLGKRQRSNAHVIQVKR